MNETVYQANGHLKRPASPQFLLALRAPKPPNPQISICPSQSCANIQYLPPFSEKTICSKVVWLILSKSSLRTLRP